MLRVGVGQSSNPSGERAAEEATAKAMAQAGSAQADCVLVFFTVDHVRDCGKLLSVIRRLAGTERIVGCSGAGILTDEGEIEGSGGLAVLVLASDSIESRPFLFHPVRDRDGEAGAEISRIITGVTAENSLLVLLPDGTNGRPRPLFDRIEEEVGFLPIVGAGSSESGAQGATFQVCGERVTSNAVAGLWLGGLFESSIGITQGCQPITEPMVITRAEGNFILEIDHRPAFESLAAILKGPLLTDLRRALAFVFIGLPADPRHNSIAAGRYLVRNIVGLDPEKGILAVAEEVFEGEQMVFTLRDPQRAREDLKQMLGRQSKNLAGKRPRLGLYFNCCARGTSLYGIPGIDTAYIRQTLGDFPLIGFFGNFELAPLEQRNHLLAYTGVLALITESFHA